MEMIQSQSPNINLRGLLLSQNLDIPVELFICANPVMKNFKVGIDYVVAEMGVLVTESAGKILLQSMIEYDVAMDKILDKHWASDYITLTEIHEIMFNKPLCTDSIDSFVSYVLGLNPVVYEQTTKEIRFKRSILLDILPEDCLVEDSKIMGTANYFLYKLNTIFTMDTRSLVDFMDKRGHLRVSETIPTEFISVADSVFWVTHELYKKVFSEESKMEYLRENFKQLLPKFEIVTRSDKNKRIFADLWVKSENGEDIPLEMKKGSFDKNALNQLNRYIKESGACKGIAVGEDLSVVLPENIEFLCISDNMITQSIRQNLTTFT